MRQDAGQIACFGHDTVAQPRLARARLGYVAQQVALDKVLTGRELLAMHGAIYHVPKAELAVSIERVLDLVGLREAAGKRLATYSGGMARRLDLATALLHKPALLVLDEPTVGLDIHTRSAIWDFVLRLAREGTAVLIASHHLEEIEYLSDRIVILDHGRVIAEGSSAQLKQAFGRTLVHLKLAEFMEPQALQDAAVRVRANAWSEKVLIDPMDGGRLVITLRSDAPGAEDVRASLAETLGVPRELFFQFSLERPSLDDVFLEATGRTLRDAPWSQEDAPAFPKRRRG
jgi:ABC-2 type transport system ATP-binding protein